MRYGVIIDSDWFFGKMGEFNINWNDPKIWQKLLHFPSHESSNKERNSVYPVLINTLAKDDSDRTKGKRFERAAKKAGFGILHRVEKHRESSSRSGYRGGSLALLGASIEALASQVDSLVVHATGVETLSILRFVMAEHKHITTVLFSNIDTEEVPEDIKGRSRLMPIDYGVLREFLESNNSSNLSTVKTVKLNELFPSEGPQKDQRIGKVVDVGGMYALETAVSCDWGSMFKAGPLKNVRGVSKLSYTVVAFGDSSTSNRERQVGHYEKAGWEVVRALFDGGKQLDDGLVGACMSRCSFNCDEVMLFGPDIDFLPV